MNNDNALKIGSVIRSSQRTYRIEQILGSGGFGITYRASTTIMFGNLTAKINIAIKEHFVSKLCERDPHSTHVRYSNPVSIQVENSKKDFLSEAKRLHKVGINHPNIVVVNEVFEANNTAYYVMEYLEGESLRSYVKRNGKLLSKEMLNIMLPIVRAIGYLHDNNMTHLDVKPDNIMLARDENGALRPVLIDFGLSKHYDEEGEPTSTINFQAFSNGYAPIEQYAGIRKFSPQSDIYALGATMYFCLTAENPERSTDINPEDIAIVLNRNVSLKLSNTIAKAMQPISKNRHKSVTEFLKLLEITEIASQQEDTVFDEKVFAKKSTDTPIVPILDNNISGKRKKNTPIPVAPSRSSGKMISLIIVLLIALLVTSTIIWSGWHKESSPIETPSTNAVLSIKIPDTNLSVEMVAVEGGTFQMGSNDGHDNEKPVHSVTLSPYHIGKYEVSQAQWKAVMGSNPSEFKGDNLPVENVTWDDCQTFISKLNQLTGKHFSLPTEAQWEFAARGGNKSKGYTYAGSNNIGDVAEYEGNNNTRTKPVGGRQPNELGIYDMSGNVFEWCQDWAGGYSNNAQIDPTGPLNGSYRVDRGGSWLVNAIYSRTVYRDNDVPHRNLNSLGLRLVLQETTNKTVSEREKNL